MNSSKRGSGQIDLPMLYSRMNEIPEGLQRNRCRPSELVNHEIAELESCQADPEHYS